MALTVKLTPGKTFQEGETWDATKLNQLANPTVTLEGGVSAAAIADGSITTAKLAAGALSADSTGLSKMADGFATTAKLADGAVATAKIADGAVTVSKLPDGVLSADATGQAKVANNFLLPQHVEYNPGALGTTGTVALDWSTGLTFTSTLTGNLTFTFANPKDGQQIIVAITQAAAGSKTVTWPGGMKWAGGGGPTMTATAGKTDVYFVMYSGGVYYGWYFQNF